MEIKITTDEFKAGVVTGITSGLQILRTSLLKRVDDMKVESMMCNHPSIDARIIELYEVIEHIQKLIDETNPSNVEVILHHGK